MTSPKPDYEMLSLPVRLTLQVGGATIALASIGPDEVVPRNPVELPRGDARVIMDVDGDRFVWPVKLPRGAVPFDKSIKTVVSGEMVRMDVPDDGTQFS